MANHKDEHVIYIKDMLFAVLYKWRTVLIVAIAAALLLGGYRYTSLQGNNPDSDALQAQQEEYQLQKETLEKEIDLLSKQIDFHNEYVDSTPSLTFNPLNVYATELHFYLEPLHTDAAVEEKVDSTDALLGAYRKLLTRKDTFASIATKLGVENMNMDGSIDVNCDQTTNLLTVIVRQAEPDQTISVPDIIHAEINNAKVTVEEVVGAHKVTVLSSYASFRNDTDLALFQTKKNDELLNLQETLKTRTAEVNALVAPSIQPTSITQILISAIKFAILGGVLGFFGAACILVLAHLARNKVYSRRTLEDQTGLFVLGCIPSTKKRNSIDRWLRKLEGRSTEASQQCSALIAARVRNLCGTEGQLLLCGAGSADDCLCVLNALENVGCTVIAKGDLLRDLDAVNALSSCTGVLFLEQCGKSLYTSVGEAATQAEALGKPVIGCILIDG